MRLSKLLAGLAVASLALAACGTSGGGTANKGTIKIGVDLPESGAEASDGIPTLNGVKYAVQTAGTVEGFTIEVSNLDDAVNGVHDPQKGAQNLQQFVNDPKVLFFDEPTAGLDPQVRREIYDIIEELKREKKTIVMTTHYIEEAERLCDRVAIVDHGKVIALGTPRDLKAHSGGTTRIEVRLSKPESNGTLKNLEGATDAREVDGIYVIHSKRPPQTIVSMVKHLEAQGNELVGLEIATPSLEDVFIEMTGRRLRD